MKALAILLFIPSVACAGYINGNKLYENMNGTDTEKIMAISYVIGVSDTLEGLVHCSKSNVTAGQSRDIVKKYLENHPETRNWAANLLVGLALSEAFPCQGKKNL